MRCCRLLEICLFALLPSPPQVSLCFMEEWSSPKTTCAPSPPHLQDAPVSRPHLHGPAQACPARRCPGRHTVFQSFLVCCLVSVVRAEPKQACAARYTTAAHCAAWSSIVLHHQVLVPRSRAGVDDIWIQPCADARSADRHSPHNWSRSSKLSRLITLLRRLYEVFQ